MLDIGPMKNDVPSGLVLPKSHARSAVVALVCALGAAGCGEGETLRFPGSGGAGSTTDTIGEPATGGGGQGGSGGSGGQSAEGGQGGSGGSGAAGGQGGSGGSGAAGGEGGSGGAGAGGSGGSGGSGGVGGSGGSGGAGGSGGVGSGGGGGATGGGNPGGVGECIPTCSAPADCTTGQGPAVFDANHYACDSGICRYLGCATDQECLESFGVGVSCLPVPGADHSECVAPCLSPASCGVPNGPALLDEDHYECNGGVCEHLGCQTDEECHPVRGPNTVCIQLAGSSIKSCLKACQAPLDCTNPGAPSVMDADNYDCVAGACHYKGCLDNGECADAYGQAWICQ